MWFRSRFYFCSVLILLSSSIVFADQVSDALLIKPVDELSQEKREVKLKLSRKEALVIAEQLNVVKALYDLRGGELANCIEKSVVKPCDSEWVTCVEVAWVVKFVVGSQCPIEHDGRLNINILIDGNTGEIRSQYPEVDYFKDKYFCRDKADCIQVDIKDNNNKLLDKQCYNFVYAQSQFAYIKKEEFKNITPSPQAITEELKKLSEFCECRQNQCKNLSSK